MNRNLFLVVSVTVFILQQTGFAETPQEKINVTVSIPPLAQFVEQVAGDYATVQIMVRPGANPHAYEPAPSQLRGLVRSQLYVAVGSGIEFEVVWLEKLKAINPKMKVYKVAGETSLSPDRTNGEKHDHGNLDPHVWLSLRRAVEMVQKIKITMIQIDPKHQLQYERNAAVFTKTLTELDLEAIKLFQGFHGRSFLVYHPAWAYFARDYGLKEIVIEENGKEPSVAHMAKVIKMARDEGIKTVIVSPQFSEKSAQVVAREISGRIIVADDLAQDYIGNMRQLIHQLASTLESSV
ncbi:MAG: zinc ABC transporter substrate-binding protein [Candidatus Omnitrophica bacterium]|nr:zinc ABC transporter substrate-binding protein [Candidatus Omnitrophota bacterium]